MLSNHHSHTTSGELGDQLFGSNTMGRAVRSPDIDLEGPWTQPSFWSAPLAKAGEQEAASVSVEDLEAFLAPQLEKCPIPVKTLFDFLWWINFSMKWQHVSLRLLHCRDHVDMTEAALLVHFFASEEFQQWSFHNHESKMLDKADWKSYKVGVVWLTGCPRVTHPIMQAPRLISSVRFFG